MKNKIHSIAVKRLNEARKLSYHYNCLILSAKAMLTQTLLLKSEPHYKYYASGYGEEIKRCRKSLKKIEKEIRNYKKIIYQSQKSYSKREICLHCKHRYLDLRFGELFYICNISKLDVDLGEICVNGKFERKNK